MAGDKRKAARRNMRRRALVVGLDNAPLADCTIADISNSGAQLNFEASDDFPAEFNLILAKGGKVRRHCKIVWREKDRVGVRFGRAE
jgi:PilZ domain